MSSDNQMRRLIPAIASVCIVLGSLAAYFGLHRSEPPKPTTAASAEESPHPQSPATPPPPKKGKPALRSPKTALREKGSKQVAPGNQTPSEVAPAMVTPNNATELKANASLERPGSTALAKQILSAVAKLDLSGGALTEEEVQDLKEQLKQLTEQGAAAIPA